MTNIITVADKISLNIAKPEVMSEIMKPSGIYFLQCRGPRESVRDLYLEMQQEINRLLDFNLFARAQKLSDDAARLIEPKWAIEIRNLVTDVGANDCQDKYFSGSAYTAAWYLMLMSSTGYTTGASAADTSASHSGWTEDTNYSQATRPAATFSAAASRSKALTTPLVFSMNATTTIKGSGLISSSTKGGTTGILYSIGLSSGGDESVSNGDTINANYTSTFS